MAVGVLREQMPSRAACCDVLDHGRGCPMAARRMMWTEQDERRCGPCTLCGGWRRGLKGELGYGTSVSSPSSPCFVLVVSPMCN